ncbi:Uncharacterised protein [Klebsiella pneumoniae]|nr:Uncharacterised protein [Klebsiella pneumoniae]
MVVVVIDLLDIEHHIAGGLKRCAVVIKHSRPAAERTVFGKLAANGERTVAVDQRGILVIERADAHCQRCPCGNRRRHAVLRGVSQRCRLQRDGVAVQAPAADIG